MKTKSILLALAALALVALSALLPFRVVSGQTTSQTQSNYAGSGSGTVSANNGSAGALANYAAAGGSTTVGPVTGVLSPSAGELDVGTNGGAGGVIGWNGATSGKATCTAPAVAGTVGNPVACTNDFSAPGYSLINGAIPANATGMFNSAANNIVFQSNGTQAALLNATSVSLNQPTSQTSGNISFTGGKGQHLNSQAVNNDLFGTTSGSTTTATVTFTTNYTSTPSCVITPTTAGVTSAIITTQANSGFTITYAPSGSTNFNYMCGGNPN